jgi:hypothetical protein
MAQVEQAEALSRDHVSSSWRVRVREEARAERRVRKGVLHT